MTVDVAPIVPEEFAVMIALIQRVSVARVTVDGAKVGSIGPGLLAFIAVQPDDTAAKAARLATRVLTYRVFSDTEDRMIPAEG